MIKHEYADYHTMEVAASPDTVTSVATCLYGFAVETDQTNDVTLVISDGSTEVLTYIVTGTTDSFVHEFTVPVMLRHGLTITLTGTASRCVVLYRKL